MQYLEESDMSDLVVGILRRIAADLLLFPDSRSIPEDILDGIIFHLEVAYRELIVLDTMCQLTPTQKEACDIVRSALVSTRSLQEVDHLSLGTVQPIQSGHVVRPSFDIPYEQLAYLIEHRFSVPHIADMLGVSVRTVRRRMSAYGLSISVQYSSISDPDLDQVVSSIQHEFPTCGNRQMQGHLFSRGIRVQQIRVREAQRRVDPDGTVLRHLNAINRREYSVAAPCCLYHIDGNHKLIRYNNYDTSFK